MMTIKQLAESIGVSKTAIRKRMAEIPDFRAQHVMTDESGVIHVDDEGCELLKGTYPNFQSVVSENAKTSENTANNAQTANQFAQTPQQNLRGKKSAEIELLEKTLAMLQDRIEKQDQEIERLRQEIWWKDYGLLHGKRKMEKAQQKLLAGPTSDEPEQKKGLFGGLFKKRS